MYGRPIDLSLLTRTSDDETFAEWTKRFAVKMGRNPDTMDAKRSPFIKFVMDACKTQEKFRWCMANVGLYRFHEIMDSDLRGGSKKIWLFDDDNDAVMFKLRWFNEKEDDEYVFDHSASQFVL